MIRNHSDAFDGGDWEQELADERARVSTMTSYSQKPFTDLETSCSPQREPETRRLPRAAQLPPVTGLPYIKAPTTVPNAISFEPDGWMSTPLLRRPVTEKGTPRSAERSAPQAGHLEFGLIVFIALAAMQFFIWLAIRGPALLERISSWQPTCFLVSCETQAQPHRETQAQPEPQPRALLQPQVQPQSQPRPQPPRRPPPRPNMRDRVVAGHEPQQRSPIECWRDRSIRGPCFD